MCSPGGSSPDSPHSSNFQWQSPRFDSPLVASVVFELHITFRRQPVVVRLCSCPHSRQAPMIGMLTEQSHLTEFHILVRCHGSRLAFELNGSQTFQHLDQSFEHKRLCSTN